MAHDCPTCGYDLSGHAGDVVDFVTCPECATAVSIHHLAEAKQARFWGPTSIWLSWIVFAAAGAAATLFGVTTLFEASPGDIQGRGYLLTQGWVLWVLVSSAAHGVRLVRRRAAAGVMLLIGVSLAAGILGACIVLFGATLAHAAHC